MHFSSYLDDPSLILRDVLTGDVFMLNVLGKNIVVINSEKAAIELMEKRSAIYNDRPPMPILERYVASRHI